MIYIPFIGALAYAVSTIMEKTVLEIKKISIKTYLVATFLGVVLVMLPFIYFFWDINPQALELKNAVIFLVVVILSIIANLFYLYSLKGEKVTKTEPARILEPLLIILLAIIFSFIVSADLYERKLNVIIPALIAGVALVFSHVKKDHIKFNKYFTAAMLGSFFFALELVITILILDFYSPMTFYFLRATSILLISLLIFKPKFKSIKTPIKLKILLISFFWVIYRVVIYYGFLDPELGIVKTILLIMMAPIFIYILARIFLKEKLSWRNIVASIVIIGCVLYATTT